MEGAALLRLFVLCIWTSGLFLGVGVRAEEATARVQQNHPGGTDTGDPQESNVSLEDYLNYFQKNVSPQEMLLLLSDHKAWERVVATAELPRDEADELYKALNKLIRHMVMKDKNWLEEVQQHRKRFLEEFPRLERELQDKIRRLCDLAGQVQKVHKGATIANAFSSTLGVASGVLTFLGLGLAPFTAGSSLVLLEPVTGLGIAAALTGITSGSVEYAKKRWAQAEAHELVNKSLDTVEEMNEFLYHNIPNFISLRVNLVKFTEDTGKAIRAIRQARANPHSVSHVPASLHRVTEPVSATSVEERARVVEMERVAESRTTEVIRGAKIVDKVFEGALFVLDVVGLVCQLKHLHEGAKSKTAEELKKVAQELEKKLNILNKKYETLRQEP
uniref:Apolipoprotein L-I n=1 Tax=Papio hamadryas TaxID=9557 RepID=C9WF17_PAPHA|nr:apolipoprotein L-I [Papio hamadryas]